jgi:hypothetical protein
MPFFCNKDLLTLLKLLGLNTSLAAALTGLNPCFNTFPPLLAVLLTAHAT